MPKNWYSIKAAADSDVAEVSILDYIGMWGVNAQDYLREFRALKASTVKVYINSPGGSVFEALAIFNGMRASGKKIEVHVLGVAASAASYIAMAGDKVVMPANTMMFVHNPINAVYGNAEELRAAADVFDKIGESLMATYRKRFKGDEEALAKLFADESYLTAAECLEYGLCDEVTEEIAAEAAFDVERLPEAVQALFKRTQPQATREPEPAPAASLSAVDIEREAKAAGVPEMAEHFALDARLTSVDALRARAAEAAEIVAVCRITGTPEMATPFVREGKTVAEAKAAIAAAKAAADEHIDTARAHAGRSDRSNATLNPTALWAEIHDLMRGVTK